MQIKNSTGSIDKNIKVFSGIWENGSIGGQMVKRMVQSYEKNL